LLSGNISPVPRPHASLEPSFRARKRINRHGAFLLDQSEQVL
jgi:hypothetical protein